MQIPTPAGTTTTIRQLVLHIFSKAKKVVFTVFVPQTRHIGILMAEMLGKATW
ncbi:MAG: hypothetical protein ACRECH_14865 [Nitrososphaerales archaeon]